MPPPEVSPRVHTEARRVDGLVAGEISAKKIQINHYSAHQGRAPAEPVKPRLYPPRSGHPNFLGREEELSRICRHFEAQPQGRSNKARVFVLSGLAGRGKSELCIQYIDHKDDDYWAIFWIDGSSKATLESGFALIAEELGLDKVDIQTAHRYLSQLKQPWLLVVDNADDPALDLAPFLPLRGSGHVLITTKNPDLKVYSPEDSLTINDLAVHDALDLFFKSAGVLDRDRPLRTDIATDIVNTLRCHTLAVIQAGSYIKDTRDWNGFLNSHNGNIEQALKYSETQAQSTYGSVFATFEVSADYLERIAGDQSQPEVAGALAILHCVAFMNSPVPLERILTDAKTFVGDCISNPPDSESNADPGINVSNGVEFARTHGHLLPAIAYAPSDANAKFQWRRACHKLQQLSLVKLEEAADGNETIHIHALVHQWARARQEGDDRHASWLSAAAGLCFSIRSFIDYSPEVARVRQQAKTCTILMPMDVSWWLQKSHMQYVCLLYHLGWILASAHHDDEFDRVCQYLKQILAFAEKEHVSLYGKDSILSQLAEQAYRDGAFPKALQILEDIVNRYKLTRAETDEELLDTQLQLAGVYTANAQSIDAVQLLEHIVKIQRQIQPETDPKLCTFQNDLADAYRSGGRVPEAIMLYQHVIKIRRQILAETSPDLLISQHQLARAYLENGQNLKAIQLLEHVVKIKEQLLAETDSHLHISQHGLACAYLANGQILEAIQLLEHVVKIREQILAETNRNRLSRQHELARAYLANGQILDAIQLLEHVVKIKEQILAETNRNRLSSQHDLARAYLINGQILDAIQLLEHVVEIQRQTLAETSDTNLTSQGVLAVAYFEAGRLEDAIPLISHVAKVRRMILPESHPSRLNSEGWLQLMQRKQLENERRETDESKNEHGQNSSDTGRQDGESQQRDWRSEKLWIHVKTVLRPKKEQT